MGLHFYRSLFQHTYIRLRSSLPTYVLVPLVVAALWPSSPSACSRLLWNTNGDEVLVGRAMDWSKRLDDTLYIMPRGMQVTGGTYENPMIWNVKYGSVYSAVPTKFMKQGLLTLEDSAVDGMNEKGFSAQALFLASSSYEKRDPSRSGVSTLRWVHYLLDNFMTVKEALAGMAKIQIAPGKIGDNPMDFHVTIADKFGDSANIEFIDGKQTIHHGRDITVMTNSPPYDAQVKNLAQYRVFGGKKPLPGNIESTDRFARLQYFSQHLPQTTDKNKAVPYILSAMRTVASPFGAPYPNGAIYPTWWISVSDLKNGIFHYNNLETPDAIQVNLGTIDFSKGSGVRGLDPHRLDLSGNVNNQFKPVDRSH